MGYFPCSQSKVPDCSSESLLPMSSLHLAQGLAGRERSGDAQPGVLLIGCPAKGRRAKFSALIVFLRACLIRLFLFPLVALHQSLPNMGLHLASMNDAQTHQQNRIIMRVAVDATEAMWISSRWKPLNDSWLIVSAISSCRFFSNGSGVMVPHGLHLELTHPHICLS